MTGENEVFTDMDPVPVQTLQYINLLSVQIKLALKGKCPQLIPFSIISE